MEMSTAHARRLSAVLAFVLAFAAAPGALLAQSAPVNVTGTVTAGDGTPIAGASVTLQSQDGTKSAAADARGKFEIRGVRAGTYSLHATAAGYASLSQRTVTINEQDAHLSVVLSPATTASLTVIGTVRASAGETVSTSSAPTLTLNAQQAAAAGESSVAPMLWSQLSTTPVLPLGGGSNAMEMFGVRGPDPRETLVDIDGHLVNNGNTGDFDLSLVDPAALQDVQVVYGISPSSLIGPNTIGGAVNIVTLEPTQTPHALLRFYGGSYGSFGGTLQATGEADRLGYAVSLHQTTSSGSVNQTILAPAPGGSAPGDDPAQTLQSVGSGSNGNSILTKLRYQLGGPTGYGYLQLNFRNQSAVRDDSSLLTNYTPPGYTGGGGDDAVPADAPSSGYQSFAGTTLGAHQSNYGLDAQLPLGNQLVNGAPATFVQFSHLTTLASQSVSGPGAEANQYLYNQRDLLGDDWLELDHHFANGTLSLKYDLGTETLGTNYVQGQVIAGAPPIGAAKTPPVQTLSLGQTQRSAVLRYAADPTAHIHYSVAAFQSNFSTFGTSFDPRAGFTWTPTGNTAVHASVGTTFQTPQLSELVVPPPADQVPVGGVIYTGNPNLKPDFATDMDIGAEQIFGRAHPLRAGVDLYQSNVRSPSSQLNVIPIPGCQTKHNPTPCPLSYPVNAGNAVYRGMDVHADQQVAGDLHVRAGWSVDSSFLTVIPASIQDGTLAAGVQSLGQPLHKAYVALDSASPFGISYGAQLSYEGWYNELNRSPYALLGAHVVYRHSGMEYGLYGENLTNVYANPFTVVGGGFVYGGIPGAPVIPTDAYTLQGASLTFVVTRSI